MSANDLSLAGTFLQRAGWLVLDHLGEPLLDAVGSPIRARTSMGDEWRRGRQDERPAGVRGELDEPFAYLLGLELLWGRRAMKTLTQKQVRHDKAGRPTDAVVTFIEAMDELMREIEAYLAFWSIACGE